MVHPTGGRELGHEHLQCARVLEVGDAFYLLQVAVNLTEPPMHGYELLTLGLGFLGMLLVPEVCELVTHQLFLIPEFRVHEVPELLNGSELLNVNLHPLWHQVAQLEQRIFL